MTRFILIVAILASLCFGFVSVAYSQGLSAHVNTTQVAEGDTFQLRLSVNGASGVAPDLAPLQKDFDVLGTSLSSQTQIINGQRSQSTNWIVNLSPRTKGTVTIPSLKAGNVSSDPLTLQVLDASQLPKSQGADGITVSSRIDDGSAYVFQEIPLTVRIESSVALQSAELIAPRGNFELTQTGQDRTSQVTRNGVPVTVVERNYLLRPQSEGALEVGPFTLKGAVREASTRRDPFANSGFGPSMMRNMMGGDPFGGMMSGSPFDSMFNPGKPFVARSDALRIDVLANPAASGTDWFLPAKAVEFQAEWEPQNPLFRAGEAVTRRVSLLALGARPEQLPDIQFSEPDGARIYLDDTQTRMVETESGTVARKDFVLSVVPTHGGEVVLPEISIEWMNTESDQMETATLAATTINVDGPLPMAAPTSDPVSPAGAPVATSNEYHIWGVAASAAGVLVAMLIAWFGYARLNRRRPVSTGPTCPSNREVRRLARSGDVMGTYNALRSIRDSATGVRRRRLSSAIQELEVTVFSATPNVPDLTRIVKQALQGPGILGWRQHKGTPEARLPALYPESR